MMILPANARISPINAQVAASVLAEPNPARSSVDLENLKFADTIELSCLAAPKKSHSQERHSSPSTIISSLAAPRESHSQEQPEEDIETVWADLRRMVGRLQTVQNVRFEEPVESVPLGSEQTIKVNREAFSDLKLARVEANKWVGFLHEDARKFVKARKAKDKIRSVTKAFRSSESQKKQDLLQRSTTLLLKGLGGSLDAPPEDMQEWVEQQSQTLKQLSGDLRKVLTKSKAIQNDDLLYGDVHNAKQALDTYKQAVDRLLP